MHQEGRRGINLVYLNIYFNMLINLSVIIMFSCMCVFDLFSFPVHLRG